MDLVLGPPDDLLRLLATQLLHGGVVVLLGLREEHLEDAALVLLLEHVEVVDDDSVEGSQVNFARGKKSGWKHTLTYMCPYFGYKSNQI